MNNNTIHDEVAFWGCLILASVTTSWYAYLVFVVGAIWYAYMIYNGTK